MIGADSLLPLPVAACGRRLLCVALSGGADSTALLHRLSRLREESGDFDLRAVHVDHRLHPQSADWAAHCEALCRGLGLDLQVCIVDAGARAGQSPEAAAREARYRALAGALAPGEALLSAHHAGDQAETLLLQLLRGAGPAGLASMPALAPFASGWLARPLLGVPGPVLKSYCREHELAWLEDPSNRSLRHDRNYLRRVVMPALESRWPSAAATLGRVASHQAAAERLLEEIASEDLKSARCPDGGAPDLPPRLNVAALAAMSRHRRENALRCWLREQGAGAPSAAQLARMLDDVVGAREDATPVLRFGHQELRRHAGWLHLRARAQVTPLGFEPVPWADAPRALRLPHGWLHAEHATGEGVRVALLEEGAVEVHARRGGERLRPRGDRHTRSLKKLLHARGLPPWQRLGLPLVYARGRLVAVPGVCVAAAGAAGAGEAGWVLRWRPDDRDGWPDA